MFFKGFKFGANRFSIRGFLAAIFHPIMSSPCDAPGVFVPNEARFSVADWRTVISNNELSKQCQLEKVIYCKCIEGKEHEFLLFHFRHPTQENAEAVVVSDRIPEDRDTDNNTDDNNNNNNNNNNRNSGSSSSRRMQSSCIVSPSVGVTPACDSVFTTPNSIARVPTHLTKIYGKFNQLTELQFTSARPSAEQLSMLLSVMNQHSQAYDLYQHQCYWYAHTIWKVLKKAFPDAFETDEAAGRSSYCGLTIKKADSVDEVYNEFCLEQGIAKQREADERRKREAEAEQLRMEGRTEGQAEERARWKAEVERVRREKEEAVRRAEEVERQKEEAVRRAEEQAVRKAEEVERQKEEAVRRAEERVRAELQAEIDRMRAQYERHAV